MDKLYDQVKDMLCDELKDLVKRKELTPNSLEVIDTSIDILKDIATIKAMEIEFPEDGYSEDGGYSNGYYRRMPYYMYDDPGMAMNNGYSRTGVVYARGGGRGSSAPRDSRGRYMSGGYSGDTREELQNLMDTAKDDREREAIRAALDHMR